MGRHSDWIGKGWSMPTRASDVRVVAATPRSAKLVWGGAVCVEVMLAVSLVRGRWWAVPTV
jgi:hypothetical protein